MIDNFKFFSDNDEEEMPEGFINLNQANIASWMWETFMTPTTQQLSYDYITVETNGIIEFLNMFPPEMIVTVSSIVGDNGIIHNGTTNHGFGWGFNIQTDPIRITYLRFNNQ